MLCSSNKSPKEIEAETNKICQETRKTIPLPSRLQQLSNLYKVAKESLPKSSPDENSPVLQSILSAIQDEIREDVYITNHTNIRIFIRFITECTDSDVVDATKNNIHDTMLNFYNKQPEPLKGEFKYDQQLNNLTKDSKECLEYLRRLEKIFPPNDQLMTTMKSKITDSINQLCKEASDNKGKFTEWINEQIEEFNTLPLKELKEEIKEYHNPEDESKNVFSKEEYEELQAKIDAARAAIREPEQIQI